MLGLIMVEPSATTICPNCERPALARYCAHCGQDNRVGRLESRRIAGEFVRNLTGWDTALGFTLKGLLRSPGAMAADYVSGRRRRFVNPARFCLLSLALWLLTARVVGLDPLDASGLKITNSSGSYSSEVTAIKAFIATNLEVLLFLSLPLRALLLRAVFRRAGRNVAECLVMVLYVAGASYLLGTLLAPFAALEQSWATPLRPLLAIAWSYWAALGFFRSGWFGTLWRIVLVSLLHVTATVILFAGVAVPWVLLTR
jgi:hypothetical protein